MIDGASMLAAPFFAFLGAGAWQDRRGENLLDSGAPFYDTYETADAGHVAVACLEPQFFAEFARLLPLEERFAAAQYDQALWPQMRDGHCRRLRAEDTRRMGGLVRADRRLRGAGAFARGSPAASAQHGARRAPQRWAAAAPGACPAPVGAAAHARIGAARERGEQPALLARFGIGSGGNRADWCRPE